MNFSALYTQKLPLFIGLSTACLLASTTCHAVLTDNLTIGNAKAISLGNAVTADPPGIDAVHFNPAGIAKLKGKQAQVKVATSSFNVKLDFEDYSASRKNWLATRKSKGIYPDNYFDDVAHNSASNTDGATLVLPGLGMTDLPVLLGVTGGVAYSPENSNYTVATAMYTPLAAGFNRSSDDPGRFISERLAFTQLTYFSPTFAIQLNEKFSIGAALTFNYSGTGLEVPFRYGGDSMDQLAQLNYAKCKIDPSNSVCSQNVGLNDELGTLRMEVENTLTYGFNAGFLWQASDRMNIGFVYQAAVPMNMEGDFYWKNSQAWDNFYTPLLISLGLKDASATGDGVTHGKAKVSMKLPEHYALGFSFKLDPKWKVNLDFKHTRWSQWKGIPVDFSETLDFLALASMVAPESAQPKYLNFPFELKDTWNAALGVTYTYSQNSVFRFGVENRPSSVPRSSQSPMLPIGDGYFYGAGYGLTRRSGATLDLALGYFATHQSIPANSTSLGNSEDPNQPIYNPYPGTNIDTELRFLLVEMSYLFPF